jgi:ribosomal protein L4
MTCGRQGTLARNDILKKAHTMTKANSMQGIEEHLNKAEKAFSDFKPLI